jgi:hypothetical protein
LTRGRGTKKSPRPNVEGATLSGLLAEVVPGQWRARGLLRVPRMFPDQESAREWLRSEASNHGFDTCDIAVEFLEAREGNARVASKVNASARKLYAHIKLGAHRVLDGWPPLF